MGKFEIYKDKTQQFRFRLKANNGQIILASEGYTTKEACKNGIQSIVKNSQEEKNFIRKTSSNGRYYFNLKSSNGQIIGTSELYASEAARETGIYAVKVNAKTDIIE